MKSLLIALLLATSPPPVEWDTCTCISIQPTCIPSPCSYEVIGQALMSLRAYNGNSVGCLMMTEGKCKKRILLEVRASGHEPLRIPWPSSPETPTPTPEPKHRRWFDDTYTSPLE